MDSDSMEATQGDGPQRKRVSRACDRCRNKKSKASGISKSKDSSRARAWPALGACNRTTPRGHEADRQQQCDGQQLCSRCQQDGECCLYSQRDKAQDKVWPKGTAETMQAAMNVMHTAMINMYELLLKKDAWPAPKIERYSEDGRPSVHDIASGVGCRFEGEVSSTVCLKHETVGDGILRSKSGGECATCVKERAPERAPERVNTGMRQGNTWSPPRDRPFGRPVETSIEGATNNSNQAAMYHHPLQAHHPPSPYINLKHEETSLPEYSPTVMPGQIATSAIPISNNLNSMDRMPYIRSRSYDSELFTTNGLPSPEMMAGEAPTQYSYFTNANSPYMNIDCQAPVMGDPCYDNCAPTSTVPCHNSFSYPSTGESEPPINNFINPQALQHSNSRNEHNLYYADPFSFHQPHR